MRSTDAHHYCRSQSLSGSCNDTNVAEGLVQCLKGDGKSYVDEGLQLNVAADISVLAQNVEDLLPLQEAGAKTVVISNLCSVNDARVKEEMVDALCAFAAHADNLRQHN